jgi:pimeloyl-ACP methyl ester carboxylesterase
MGSLAFRCLSVSRQVRLQDESFDVRAETLRKFAHLGHASATVTPSGTMPRRRGLSRGRSAFSMTEMSRVISRRTFSAGLVAGAAASALGVHNEARAAVSVGNVVLVHGAYADGSSWSGVIRSLQSVGIRVTAVQNPLTSLTADVEATRRALAMQNGPTVLVAHSYGGMVISEAGVDPNVSALVYVAARAPDAGEDYTALAARFPAPPASAGLVKSGDYAQLSQDAFLTDFANGVDPVKARELYAVQAPIAATLFPTAKTTVAAWRSKPSWYAVSKQDRTINPDLERYMAARMKATTIELNAGHLSLVSHPKEISNLILTAAGR